MLNRNLLRYIYLLPLLVVLLQSCDNKPQATDDIPLPPKVEGTVFILNEGNFQFGNASITVMDKSNNQVYENVFESVNKRKLGDVLQSMSVVNGQGYLVVNNSRKIEVIDPQTYLSKGTITGFTSPRYIYASGNKAYVTEYYADAVRVVDLTTQSIVSSISINGWGEEMAYYNSKLYVCNANHNKVYVINTATDQLADSITVGTEPLSIRLDAESKLWVLCKGNKDQNIKPSMWRIDPAKDSPVVNFEFGSPQDGGSRLCTNAEKTKLFWISKHIYTMNISGTKEPSNPMITSVGQNFYALSCDPYTNDIYVADALDFVQRSNIIYYSASGMLRGQFRAGLISGGFYFYKK